MSKKNSNRLGRYLCKILRNKPGIIGITLDEHGWADVDELIAGVRLTQPLDMAALEELVHTDPKQRYSFNESHRLIRANQGHSIPVDVQPARVTPPEQLWHGTAASSVDSILQQGILRMGRLHVHLSADWDTARQVGIRHGRPCVLCVHTGRMARDGYSFYLSANNVWLTDFVPPQYVERV